MSDESADKADLPVMNTLAAEFDAMLERMQMPEVQAGILAGLRAFPEKLGRAELDGEKAKQTLNPRPKTSGPSS